MKTMHHYTDYEAALILVTLVRCDLEPHSPQFLKELEDYPQFEQVFVRHTIASVSLRWNDFRTALDPNLKTTRGAHLKQIRRIARDWQWLTGIEVRTDLNPLAA